MSVGWLDIARSHTHLIGYPEAWIAWGRVRPEPDSILITLKVLYVGWINSWIAASASTSCVFFFPILTYSRSIPVFIFLPDITLIFWLNIQGIQYYIQGCFVPFARSPRCSIINSPTFVVKRTMIVVANYRSAISLIINDSFRKIFKPSWLITKPILINYKAYRYKNTLWFDVEWKQLEGTILSF